jgi:eukaryotic-like serine/threonine-protein kinase
VRRALGEVDELEDLGGGGQGRVWRVKQNGQETVLKVIPGAEDAERVRREAESLRSINSLRVMAYHDTTVIEDGDQRWPAIRGEYVPGGTVADALKRDERPTVDQALRCARGVLEGVAAIHELGRVHRDIKPQNVALRNGAWDEPVVLDLGLVRDLDNSITRYPEMLGTLPFMAPEQLRLERAVRRTDVFAVGALLLFVLTSELPYIDNQADQGLSSDALRLAMLSRTEQPDWPRWGQLQARLDQDVAELLAQLLGTEPYERPTVERGIGLIDTALANRSR